MIHRSVGYPEDLQEKIERLHRQFFDQFENDDDEAEEGAFDRYINEHASEELRDAIRETREYIASLPPNVHV